MIPREVDQFRHNLLANTKPLMVWMNRYVANIGTVSSICKRPANGYQFSGIIDKTLEHTIRERNLQIGKVFLS